MVTEVVSELTVTFGVPVTAVITALRGTLLVPVPKRVFGEAGPLTWNLHHTSHLSPHQTLRKYRCCIIEV